MKILFYMHPMVEEGDPTLRSNSITAFTLPLITAIRHTAIGSHHVIYVHTNEALHPLFAQDLDRLDILLTDDNSLPSADNVDVVLCCGTYPELATLYPGKKVFHVEYVFSRAPFPTMIYMDKQGMMGGDFLPSYLKEDSALQESDAVQKLCAGIRAHVEKTTPYKEIMAAFGDPRDCLLLPLGGGDPQGLVDHIDAILSLTNKRVILTTHPDRSYLKYSAMRELARKHKNLIWHPEFEAFYSQSIYLMPWCDSVFVEYPGRISSVILQSLFFNLNLFHLNHLHRLSFPKSALHKLLTRYAIHSDQYLDGNFLLNFLQNEPEQFCDIEEICEKLLYEFKRFPPQPAQAHSWSRDRLVQTVNQYHKMIGMLTGRLDLMGIEHGVEKR